jgi:hypothetical protein
MAGVQYGKLVRLFEKKSVPEARMLLAESFEAKETRYSDIDLGRLFCECFGWHEFQACRSGQRLANDVMQERLYDAKGGDGRLVEAQGAVATTAFQNISGQIVYSAILEPYQSEDFVFTRLIPEADTAFLDGEKIAGITEIGDVVAVRPETYPYTLAGPGENWIFTPPVLDRGVIVPVTWEAVFNDRTGRLLDRCRDVGKWAGTNKEKRAIDCVIDGNTTRHRYNWRGTVIASYGDNTGSHTWDNLSASNPLVDWTSLNVAEQNMNALVDPFTGEPITVEAKHLVVPKSLQHTAERNVRATMIRVATPGFATSGNPTQTEAPNPYANRLEVLTSRLLGARITAASGNQTDWWMGDVSAYAKYMVAERMQVVSAPPSNMDEFQRRIVQQFRVNERGAFTVVEPRALNKSTA